jgi:predicted RND superfamily exporter protein
MSPENNEDGTKLHLQEAENLKKQWYSYVLVSIQKLSDKIDENNAKIFKYKEDLLEFTSKYKEDAAKEFAKIADKSESNLKNTEERLVRNFEVKLKDYIKNLESKLTTDFKESISEEIQKQEVKCGVGGSIENLKDEIKLIDKSQTITKTKLGVYIALSALITTAIVTTLAGGVLFIFQDALTKFLGLE